MSFDQQFMTEAVPQLCFIQGTISPDPYFSADLNTLREGEIFVPPTGAGRGVMALIEQAITKGAVGLMLEDEYVELLKGICADRLHHLVIIKVPNTLHALCSLARAWRGRFLRPVMGITGSVGKTSTKRILSSIFKSSGIDVLIDDANEGSLLDCALTLLRLRPTHKAAALEMRICRRGEMAELADLVRPTNALINNIGHSHMAGLGSLPDIALEKREIFKYFTEKSIGIVNGDIPLLGSVSYAHPVIKFGAKTINQVQARKIALYSDHAVFTLKLYKEKYQITIRNNHVGVVFNTLAAVAAAYLMEVPPTDIIKAIGRDELATGKFERRELRFSPGILIDDAQDANPESVKAALLAFEKIKTRAQKIVILGDMLELGVNSPFWHRQIGRFLRKTPSVKHLILVGDSVRWVKKTAPIGLSIDLVPSWQEACDKLKSHLVQESCVLVKGPAPMALHNIVDEFSVTPR